MDQVSPALQYGLDKVETCSWESSSPHACQSSNEGTLATELGPSTSGETVAYSMMTYEGNPRSRSRDSTAEPSSPANLQILQEPDCKDEEQNSSEYSCGLPVDNDTAMLEVADLSPSEVQSKKDHRGYRSTRASASTFEEEEYQHMTAPLSSSTSAESSRPLSAPQCLQLGTYLQPGKQDKNIIVSLEGAELWHQFYQAGTEMIITKSGRYKTGYHKNLVGTSCMLLKEIGCRFD